MLLLDVGLYHAPRACVVVVVLVVVLVAEKCFLGWCDNQNIEGHSLFQFVVVRYKW